MSRTRNYLADDESVAAAPWTSISAPVLILGVGRAGGVVVARAKARHPSPWFLDETQTDLDWRRRRNRMWQTAVEPLRVGPQVNILLVGTGKEMTQALPDLQCRFARAFPHELVNIIMLTWGTRFKGSADVEPRAVFIVNHRYRHGALQPVHVRRLVAEVLTDSLARHLVRFADTCTLTGSVLLGLAASTLPRGTLGQWTARSLLAKWGAAIKPMHASLSVPALALPSPWQETLARQATQLTERVLQNENLSFLDVALDQLPCAALVRGHLAEAYRFWQQHLCRRLEAVVTDETRLGAAAALLDEARAALDSLDQQSADTIAECQAREAFLRENLRQLQQIWSQTRRWRVLAHWCRGRRLRKAVGQILEIRKIAWSAQCTRLLVHDLHRCLASLRAGTSRVVKFLQRRARRFRTSLVQHPNLTMPLDATDIEHLLAARADALGSSASVLRAIARMLPSGWLANETPEQTLTQMVNALVAKHGDAQRTLAQACSPLMPRCTFTQLRAALIRKTEPYGVCPPERACEESILVFPSDEESEKQTTVLRFTWGANT